MAEENITSKPEEERDPFKDYAENNSVGGLPNVLTGDSKIRRIVWLVILLVCVAGSIYILRNDFVKITNQPTATTISSTTEKSLDFPAVTICNLNAFSASSIAAIERNLITDIQNAFNSTKDVCHKALSKYHATQLEQIDYTHVIKSDIRGLIGHCRFGGQDCDFANDFNFTITRLGICYTFNSGRSGQEIRKVNGSGVRNGLQLLLNINQNDYTATTAGDAGVKIAVHSQSEPPLPDELGVAVSPGSNTFISFRKYTYEDETARNCRQAGDTKDWNFLRDVFNYSQAACLTESLYTTIADKCDCVVTDLPKFLYTAKSPSYKRKRLCTLIDLCCNIEQYTAPVTQNCVPACSFEEYQIAKASTSRFPANYIMENTPHFGDSNFASANIYFESLTVRNQHTEFSYGIEEFFAEVGGQVGLFIGISVISLFEFIFFLFDATMYCLRGKTCRAHSRKCDMPREYILDENIYNEPCKYLDSKRDLQ